MADYVTTTIIEPPIPLADMTALERLILNLMFDSETEGDGLSFFAPEAVNQEPVLARDTLIIALLASEGVKSSLRDYLKPIIESCDQAKSLVEIDLTGIPYEGFFQDIVSRSPTLDRLTITSIFTCSKMRREGFGGMVVVVTAGAILGKSLSDMAEDLLAQAAEARDPAHTVLRLCESAVRREIDAIIEMANDLALDTIPREAISPEDIHAACLFVAAEYDQDDQLNSLQYRAVRNALQRAKRRQEQQTESEE